MRFLAPLPGSVPAWHPATVLATWFGAGRLRPAPGTWGSLAALPCAAGITWLGGPWALAGGAAVVFLAGVWASGQFARASGEHDAGMIVVDEVAGQWLALLPVATDLKYYVLAFLLFRAFDIAKPWPISWLDRRVGGGLGVMIDDVAAGAAAALLVWVAAEAMGSRSCFPERWPG